MADFFKTHAGSATGVMREMKDFVWWALILGDVVSGVLLAYVFAKSNVTTAGAGASMGAVLGLLMSAGFDLVMYATSNLSTTTGMVADIACFTVLSAVAGAVVAAVGGMAKKAA